MDERQAAVQHILNPLDQAPFVAKDLWRFFHKVTATHLGGGIACAQPGQLCDGLDGVGCGVLRCEAQAVTHDRDEEILCRLWVDRPLSMLRKIVDELASRHHILIDKCMVKA